MLLVLLAFCALLLRNFKKKEQKKKTFTVNSLYVCLDLICFQLINKSSHLTSLPLCLVFVGGEGSGTNLCNHFILKQQHHTTRNLHFSTMKGQAESKICDN